VLQWVAACSYGYECCNVLQCVAVCCDACVADEKIIHILLICVLQCVAMCCGVLCVLQCVAVCCNVL